MAEIGYNEARIPDRGSAVFATERGGAKASPGWEEAAGGDSRGPSQTQWCLVDAAQGRTGLQKPGKGSSVNAPTMPRL